MRGDPTATSRAVPAAAKAPFPQPLAPRQHEALCRQCGKCCYLKIIIGHTTLITPFPCRFLDIATHTCAIYERRYELNPRCLSVEEGLRRSAFPADCPYVAAYAQPEYRAPVEQWDWQGQWAQFDELAAELEVEPAMREKIRARGPQAPPLWTEPRNHRPRPLAP